MRNLLLLSACLLLFCACGEKASRFVIGVSQCSDDEWRHKMNNEILREALFYDGVKVEIRTAKDNNRKQLEDIRYFMDKGVDLLIVAPNEAAPMTPVVEEAFNKGIPVVVIDRKILSDKYTAFVGADNYEIGKAVGNYVAERLKGRGKVAELTGLTGSTPAVDRHQGFVSALSCYPDIQLLAFEDAEWLQSPASEKMDTLLARFPEIDLVFAQNDRMAVGAYLSAKKQNREKSTAFIGIDALPGEDYGVDQVLKGVLDATFIYPTGGDVVMQTAMAILMDEAFQRENILSTAVVDKTNARVMKLQTDHIAELDSRIELLNVKINTFLSRFANQQFLLYASLCILILLICISFLIYKAYRSKNRLNRELSKRNDEITSQKEQLEEQRDRLIILSKQLEEATHAKLVFFTNVSHDFRTPLTLIADPVEQLLSEEGLSGTQHKLLTIIRRNVNILLRLVNQILDFRKYENGKLELCLSREDLSAHMAEWNSAFQSVALKKHVKFSFEAAGDASYVMDMDVEKMERIYFNLLSNAFKFTPENGKVSVRLSSSVQADIPLVCLEVSDTGIGISAGHIQSIFDRFYKIDLHHGGSGIGLALVKAFVELHGGRIQVESKPDAGTLFIVEIPMSQGKGAEETFCRTTVENIGSLCQADVSPLLPAEEFSNDDDCEELTSDDEKELLLIIDDNPEIREYVRLLMQEGFTVIEAEDGRDGIKKAMKYVPDIIICDVMMPVMDGIECCRLLKQELQTSHIPVILLTACALDEQRIEGFESGADSYISKPFNSKVLEARVRNLLGNRKRLKQFFGDGASLAKENVSDTDKGFVEKFKKLIEESLSDSGLNVEDLGRSMGMSRVQLYRKIKSLTNYAPNELLRIARLKKAASLLASSDKTVAEITYEVGFTSPSYFSKCYKEYFGESPTEFLKRKG